MKFHIISYDLQFLEDGQQSFRLDFKYTGEPRSIRIKLTEPIFETFFNELGGVVRVGPGHNFFAATTLMEPFKSKFNLDLKLEFLEDETNEVLETFMLPTYAVDIKKRRYCFLFLIIYKLKLYKLKVLACKKIIL